MFVTAGVAKLLDPRGSRQAMADFGAPAALARVLAIALPLAEIGTATALLPAETAPSGAIGAVGLLGLFTAAIAFNLSRGRAPDCHCFGQLHSTPAGPSTLARNVALLAIAVLVLTVGWSDPGPSAVAWLGDLDASGVAAVVAGSLAVAVGAIGGWLGLRLMRAYGRVLLRLERLEARLREEGIEVEPKEQELPVGLPLGSKAPEFSVPALDGRQVVLRDLLGDGAPLMILFTDPGCGPCQALMPEIGRWQEEHSAALRVAVVSGGAVDEVRTAAGEHGVRPVLLDEDRDLYNAYEANGTPSAVLVDAAGRIASGVAAGKGSIERLLERALADDGSQPESGEDIPIGEPVPEATLTDLNGARRDLRRMLTGSETVVIFWNPACGFCQEMLDDLKGIETKTAREAPNLQILSSGDIEATRRNGFRSPVLIDPGFEVGASFGAGGTPTAVRVDAAGRIASPVAVGIDEVLALVRPALEVHTVKPA